MGHYRYGGVAVRRSTAVDRRAVPAPEPCRFDWAWPDRGGGQRRGDRVARPGGQERPKHLLSAPVVAVRPTTVPTERAAVEESSRPAWRLGAAAAQEEPALRAPSSSVPKPRVPKPRVAQPVAMGGMRRPSPDAIARWAARKPAVATVSSGERPAVRPASAGEGAVASREQLPVSKERYGPDRRSDPGQRSVDSSLRKCRPSAR